MTVSDPAPRLPPPISGPAPSYQRVAWNLCAPKSPAITSAPGQQKPELVSTAQRAPG